MTNLRTSFTGPIRFDELPIAAGVLSLTFCPGEHGSSPASRGWDCTEAADLFVLIGTSGNVQPAARLMERAKDCGAATVKIKLEPSEVTSAADHIILGNATEVVPEWVT